MMLNKLCYQFLLASFILVLSLLLSEVTYSKSLNGVPKDLIIYDSKQGIALFENSQLKNDFWKLSEYFETQKSLAYCGVATSAMVLNAFHYDKLPFIADEPEGYKLVTQDNLFTHADIASLVISPQTVSKQGLTLDELGSILSKFENKMRVIYADSVDLNQFRKDAISVLKSKDSYIIVNFDRKPLYGVSYGHISPLAAYNEKTDRFLLLDVARYRYPPVWIKAQDLLEAMNTKDETAGKYRGYIIISK